MKTIRFGQIQGLAILVHSAEAPADDEWAAYLEFMKRYLAATAASPRFLVVTAGGAPSPSQRRAMDLISGAFTKTTLVAVVTGSTFVRGVLRAFNLVNPRYKGFEPNALDEALHYLEQSPSVGITIKRTVEDWRTAFSAAG
jgi:hypothetical protein